MFGTVVVLNVSYMFHVFAPTTYSTIEVGKNNIFHRRPIVAPISLGLCAGEERRREDTRLAV